MGVTYCMHFVEESPSHSACISKVSRPCGAVDVVSGTVLLRRSCHIPRRHNIYLPSVRTEGPNSVRSLTTSMSRHVTL
jgi:hypothetical protein